MKRNEIFFEEFNQKYLIFAHATQTKNEEIKKQELRVAEDAANLMRRLDIITHELKTNHNNFATLHTEMFTNQEIARNEGLRKVKLEINQEFKVKCDKDNNELNALSNKLNNEFNTAKVWITSKIDELEKKFSDKVREEVDLCQEDRKREKIRNEKERLKKIAEENKRILDEERLAEEKRQHELRMQEVKQLRIFDIENFINITVYQKIAFFEKLNFEKFYTTKDYAIINDIKISNDCDYGFVCIIYSGIVKQMIV